MELTFLLADKNKTYIAGFGSIAVIRLDVNASYASLQSDTETTENK